MNSTASVSERPCWCGWYASLAAEDVERYMDRFRPNEKTLAMNFYHRQLNRMTINDMERMAWKAVGHPCGIERIKEDKLLETNVLKTDPNEPATREQADTMQTLRSPHAATPADATFPPSPAWVQNNDRVREILQKDLFFVVGCQKSGTTWVMKLLDSHPEIACIGEACFWPHLLSLLQQALATYNKQQRVGDTAAFSDAQLEYLFTTSIALILGNALGDRTVKCLGEKTPEHAMVVPVLAKLLPQAKFVHIIRDGRDAAISGWFQNIRLKGEAFKKEHPNLNSYAELFVRGHWMPYIQTARSISQSAPKRYFELRYEDLHANPEPIVHGMLEFLNVDAHEDHITQCLNDSAFERCSGGRKRGEAKQDSFYRKGIVGDWKNHFDPKSAQTFMAHGGAMLRELGYER